jgi:hypothetical protein
LKSALPAFSSILILLVLVVVLDFPTVACNKAAESEKTAPLAPIHFLLTSERAILDSI